MPCPRPCRGAQATSRWAPTVSTQASQVLRSISSWCRQAETSVLGPKRTCLSSDWPATASVVGRWRRGDSQHEGRSQARIEAGRPWAEWSALTVDINPDILTLGFHRSRMCLPHDRTILRDSTTHECTNLPSTDYIRGGDAAQKGRYSRIFR
jgi:hypothetical protein